MAEIQPNSIEQAQRLYEAMTKRPTRLTASADEVLAALRRGESRLLVELPWGEVRDGELHQRHQVILMRLEKERVYFINALHASQPVGSVIEGLSQGPVRRVEASGLESMEVGRFRELFARGGKGLLASDA